MNKGLDAWNEDSKSLGEKRSPYFWEEVADNNEWSMSN
jgi:hypothetical protein